MVQQIHQDILDGQSPPGLAHLLNALYIFERGESVRGSVCCDEYERCRSLRKAKIEEEQPPERHHDPRLRSAVITLLANGGGREPLRGVQTRFDGRRRGVWCGVGVWV